MLTVDLLANPISEVLTSVPIARTTQCERVSQSWVPNALCCVSAGVVDPKAAQRGEELDPAEAASVPSEKENRGHSRWLDQEEDRVPSLVPHPLPICRVLSHPHGTIHLLLRQSGYQSTGWLPQRCIAVSDALCSCNDCDQMHDSGGGVGVSDGSGRGSAERGGARRC